MDDALIDAPENITADLIAFLKVDVVVVRDEKDFATGMLLA